MGKPANTTIFISMVHDTRREKNNRLYPVKLRVFFKPTRKQKLYPTKFEFTKKDFRSIYLTEKPREEVKDMRRAINRALDYANEVAKGLHQFSFEAFEKKMFSRPYDSQNIFKWYDSIILSLRENKQFGTANNYEVTSKSIKAFVEYKTNRSPSKCLFHDVTKKFLKEYESWMIEKKNRSVTTVSIYLRTLRTVFNSAIEDGEISKEIYPFGKRNDQYQIPAARNIKKALGEETLKKLFDAVPRNNEEERAKDLFFFSYLCNGMNTKDIAELKFKNRIGDTLQFNRAKTANTAKANQLPTEIYLTEYTQGIVDKYCNKDQLPDGFIFPFLSHANSPYENFRKAKNLVTSINHSIKRLALAAEITEKISTYTARHSFVTNALRNGATMEFVSEALGHSNMKTTQDYWAGFGAEVKKEISEKLESNLTKQKKLESNLTKQV